LTHNPSDRLIEDKVSNADIIYVGGGNTKKMLSMWRKYNLHAILKEAWEKGTILSGVSAGAVCWFSYAHSDSLKEKTGEYCRVKGLGFIRGLACPHLIRESDRLPSFKKMHNKYGGMGFAIDDYAAIVFRGNEVYSVASRPNSHTHLYSNNKKTTLQNVR
jgi:dipeptidase E